MRSVLLLSALLSLAAPASAATFSTLHGFCSGTGCSDGSVPSGGLVMDALGRLYGTTFGGGAHDGGAVYMLVPNADRTAWTNQVLYSFCARKSCRDSKGPGGPLVLDTQGNLYGTTQGDTFNGIHPSIFKLSPNAINGHGCARIEIHLPQTFGGEFYSLSFGE